jgi:hypothetical protein
VSTTPMQKLKQHFKNFEDILKSNSIQYKEIGLNKSSASSNYFSDNLGVVSDFIKIYSFSQRDDEHKYHRTKIIYSIGFVFDYIDKPINESTIKISLKPDNAERDLVMFNLNENLYRKAQEEANESIMSSPEYSIEEFRELIKGFNKELKEHTQLNSVDMIDLFLKKMLKMDNLTDDKLEQSKKEISQFLKRKEKVISKLEESIEEKESILKKEKDKISVELEKSTQQQEVDRLAAEYKAAKTKLRAKEKQLATRYKIPEIESELRSLKNKKQVKDSEIVKEKRKLTSSYISKLKS